MTYLNGDVYIGNWLNNYYNGKGVTIYKEGSVLITNYVNKLKHGPS